MEKENKPTEIHNPYPPEGYPFLRIAADTEKDYGDVLQHADSIMHGRCKPVFAKGSEIDLAIAAAVHEQNLVRDGYKDWQTGELRSPAHNPSSANPTQAELGAMGVYA